MQVHIIIICSFISVAGAKQKKKKDKDDIKIEDFATPETSPSDIGEEKMVHNPPPPPPLPGQFTPLFSTAVSLKLRIMDNYACLTRVKPYSSKDGKQT